MKYFFNSEGTGVSLVCLVTSGKLENRYLWPCWSTSFGFSYKNNYENISQWLGAVVSLVYVVWSGKAMSFRVVLGVGQVWLREVWSDWSVWSGMAWPMSLREH